MTKYIEKVIIYSTKQFKGKFKYADLLIQGSDIQIEEYYPVELQFQIATDEPYFRFSTNNRDILSKRIAVTEMLLSLFTQFYFFDFTKSESPLITYEEKDLEYIERGKIKWYQDKSLDDRNVEYVVFPEQMELLYDRYYKLIGKEKQIFQNAISLFYKAISIKPDHPSLSFLCLVTLIESMTQIEFKDKNDQIEECPHCHTIKKSPWNCEKCESPLWGIGKKYKLFISKYCFGNKPTDVDNSFLNKVYSTRSKMVHNGEVMQLDDFWDAESINWEESFLHKDLLTFTRIALLNWLLMKEET